MHGRLIILHGFPISFVGFNHLDKDSFHLFTCHDLSLLAIVSPTLRLFSVERRVSDPRNQVKLLLLVGPILEMVVALGLLLSDHELGEHRVDSDLNSVSSSTENVAISNQCCLSLEFFLTLVYEAKISLRCRFLQVVVVLEGEVGE